VGNLDVILPAGGTIDAEFARAVLTRNKALIRLAGRTLLQRTFDAVGALPNLGRVMLVGDEDVEKSPEAKQASNFFPSGGSAPENILKALWFLAEGPNAPERVLIVTTDLPYLTGDHLLDFLERCRTAGGPEKDMYLPIINRPEFEVKFPGIENTYMPLRDGEWTAGCAYLVTVKSFLQAIPHIERVFQNRKSKVGMAKLLGPVFLAKYLTRQVDVPQVLAKVESIIRCSGAAVRGAAPELAFDIDFLDDYEYARRQLEA